MLLTAITLSASQPAATVPVEPCTMHAASTGADAIAYRDCGEGPVVLIIPGGPGLDADYVAPLARMVTDMHDRAIVIEPRGTGASRGAIGDGSRLTVAGSIADVDAVRQAAGADKVTVIGHSFGGAVAQAYAAAFPGHIAKLILLDSTGPDLRTPKATRDGWRKRATPEELRRYDAARAGGNRIEAMRLKFRIGFYDQRRGEAFDAVLKDSQIHLDVAALSDDYLLNYHIAPQAGTSFHVILVAGDIDWIRGSEPALRATYPAACSMIVPDAGHFPWVDAPKAFRETLRRALKWQSKPGEMPGR